MIGGTGMLEGVCQWLVEEGYHVYVVHRKPESFKSMQEKSKKPNQLHSLTVDYHDTQALKGKVREVIDQHGGCPDLIVSWIHNSAPLALSTILKEVETRIEPWKLIHVQGSSSFFVKENTTVPEACEYRRVYLGFVLEDGSSRWLTHDEISNGVIKVIKRNIPEAIIGTLKPWSMRPH